MPHIPGQEELQSFDWQGAKVDTVAAKARPGDVVFPVELAKDNPLLVAAMKMAIAQAGADPNAYIAGAQGGNYNPLTGQQHFFLKKAFKKVKKGWDKFRKSKIGGAVMNIAAPIAGFAIGGPAGAALASGAAAKATGASTKNAILMGGLSGLTFGAASKFGGLSAGKGNFFTKFGNTSKGLAAFGKTGIGKATNLGGKLVQGALSRPKTTAAVAGLGLAGVALARSARNRTPGDSYQRIHDQRMRGYGQFLGRNASAPQQNNQFYNQMYADQTARQQQMLNQSMNIGMRAAQLPDPYLKFRSALPGQGA